MRLYQALRVGAFLGLQALGAAQAQEPTRLVSAVLRAPQGTTGAVVALPDSWNAQRRAGTWEYEIVFAADDGADDPWALFVPRVGNRAAIYLNGGLVARLGRFEQDLSDHANRPHLFALPRNALLRSGNVLRVVVQGEAARYAGLSDVYVGPATTVRPLFVVREALQVWGSVSIMLVSAMFGLMAGALALKTKDKSFAIFAFACFFCAVRTSYAVVLDPPMDYRLWAALLDACYAAYLACLCLFCVDVLDLHQRWITIATRALIVATIVLLPVYAWARYAPARQILLALMVLYALALCTTIIYSWYRTRTSAASYLAAAGAASVGLAIYDHIVVFYTTQGYSSLALARYSLILFVLAMGALLVDRYARQMQQETRLRRDVELELAEKRRALEAHFDRQQEIVAGNLKQRERERLLQDLHDGMGLQLNGLLALVQNGPLERTELTLEVRTAIEELRLLLDSTERFDGDLSILLGHIRYRIEQRLQRQGIGLVWDVALHEPQRTFAPQHAIALQRLVFELVTNTLKHSGATTATFIARCTVVEPGLHIIYADNGRGLGGRVAGPGFGMRTMQRRAADLHGRLDVTNSLGAGFRAEITVPPSAYDAQSVAADPTVTPAIPGITSSG